MTSKLFETYDSTLIEAELVARGGSGQLASMSSNEFEKKLDALGISVQQFTTFVAERAYNDRCERQQKRELTGKGVRGAVKPGMISSSRTGGK
jgi:hypothetical protein